MLPLICPDSLLINVDTMIALLAELSYTFRHERIVWQANFTGYQRRYRGL